MININLVPNHLRQKRKERSAKLKAISIPKEVLIGLGGGLVTFLFVVHIVLQIIIFVKFASHAEYEKKFNAIVSDKQKIDDVEKKLRELQRKKDSIEKITTEKRISWSQKLNLISDSLPRGLWLTRLSVNSSVLLIEGSAVSKANEEMISVGNFTSQLKKYSDFMNGLGNIEVGSIQRRKIKTIEVADFLITAQMQ